MFRALRAAVVTSLGVGLLVIGPQVPAERAASVADPAASTYTSRSPLRVLDTRNGTGTGGATTPVGPGGAVTLDLAAFVPVTATAVVLNVTGVQPTASTHVTVFPGGTARPTSSSLNLVPGEIRANQVTVTLGANRTVSLYNNSGDTHLVADLAGHYGTGSGGRFTALLPNRLLDTRWDGPALGHGATRVVDLADRVPTSATAVTFNLTATNVTASTHLIAWPTGAARPTASNLNLTAGETRTNLVTVAVGANRQVSLYNNAGSADVVLDLAGFYTPDYGAAFLPLPPTRVLDTRDGTGGTTGPLGPGRPELELDLADRLPLTSTGVLLNLTGVDATADTAVTAWATGEEFPADVSVLNVAAGRTAPNAAMIGFGEQRSFRLFNSAGSLHVVADLAGVFAIIDEPCAEDCVHAWGQNDNRVLGTAQAVPDAPSPAPAVTLSGVRAVAGGVGTGYALLSDGTVRAWGLNDFGQLGNGWTSFFDGGGSAAPVPVVGLAGVTAIAGANGTGYALRSDGTVWAWGINTVGQLGNGTFGDSTVPVRVAGLTDVVAIAGARQTGYAVRADGTVWAWGSNRRGELGNGSLGTSSFVPVQVSGLTGVTAVASSAQAATAYALRTDGTVRAWGDDFRGQLGTGQPCVQPCYSGVPVQVTGLTDVHAIAGGSDNGYAVRDDGTVWTWGAGYDGLLGNGVECTVGTCESRVPVQVSNLADVTRVATFDGGGLALRADGTVWAWGRNWHGTLGNGQVSDDHSVVPVPVQGLSGVGTITGGANSAYALVP